MRVLVVLLTLCALLAPTAAAKTPAVEFPSDLAPLVGGWIEDAADLGEGRESRPWFGEANGFLEKAREAHEQGRFRVAMYDIETYSELLRTGELMDEAANLTSDADRKTLVAERTRAWNEEADAAWTRLRADMHETDGKLRSLHSIERALYAGDIAITARLSAEDYARVAGELARRPSLDEGYVLALVRASHTPLLNLEWASGLLDTLGALEGLEPRILEEEWGNITEQATLPVEEGSVPPQLEPYEKVGKELRESGEGLLSTALSLAELRASRASGIFVIFGDAQSRGKDVVGDASNSLSKQLANTTMDSPRGVGLQGLFTADAIDRASYALEFRDSGKLELGTVVGAWASLDHATYVKAALETVSPIRPTPPVETPVPVGFALAAIAVAAILARRAR